MTDLARPLAEPITASPKTIAVVAPSGVPDAQALREGLDVLRGWGHRVVEGPHLHRVHRYTAGDGAERAADLAWALSDPAVDVVWVARGGFGVQPLLPGLAGISSPGKLVIGCSDATALLHWLYLRGHRRLVHGPWVAALASDADDATRAAVRALLERPEAGGCLVGEGVGEPGRPVRGPLLGGNLTMLASMAGTPWALRAEGAILMLEDITEHAFRLDRSLLQLRLSGALAGVRAVALGEFVRCYLPAGADYTAAELVAELLRPLGVPVLRGVGFGHGLTNLAWPYGRQATLDGATLAFEGEPAT